jgi:hypothetical protein
MRRGPVLLRVVLLGTTVVLVVELRGTLLGLVVGTELVDLVHAVRLGQFVDLAANEASQELLSKGMVDLLACASVRITFETIKTNSTYPPYAGGPRRA